MKEFSEIFAILASKIYIFFLISACYLRLHSSLLAVEVPVSLL